MPKGYPKAGKARPKMPRVYRPDLTDHFVLVHPKKQCGIVKFNSTKTKVLVAYYRFDDDGDMHIGKQYWQDITDAPKGKAIYRARTVFYMHDFIKPLANPYA